MLGIGGVIWRRTTMQNGEVWELDSEKGSRLLYAAGSAEAIAFSAKYGDPDHPVDLDPPEPTYTDDDLAAAEAELAAEEATEPTESSPDEAPDEALEEKP